MKERTEYIFALEKEIEGLVHHRQRMKHEVRKLVDDVAFYKEDIKKLTQLIDKKMAERYQAIQRVEEP